MATFYFVGGPEPGQLAAFRERLAAIGGPPPGWRILPHAARDGQALHIVDTADVASIDAHLEQLGLAYRRGPIVEVIDPRPSPTARSLPATAGLGS